MKRWKLLDWTVMLSIFVVTLCFVQCTQPLTARQQLDAQNLADANTAARSVVPTVIDSTQAPSSSREKEKEILGKVSDGTGVVTTAATKPGATRQDVVNAVETVVVPLIPEPYKSYVLLGSFALNLLGGLFAKRQTTALASTTSGIQSALVNGSLVATSAAAETVDAAFSSNHPASVVLYDALSAAATRTSGGAGTTTSAFTSAPKVGG